MGNFYHRSLLHYEDTILPLTSFLSSPKGSFVLSADALVAFDKVKTVLANTTLLTHSGTDAAISLMVDTSNVSVVAVLQLHLAGHTQSLAFFSRKLSSAETRCSTFGRGLLAVFLAMKHFRHFLEDREFTVFSDHEPLSFALKLTSDKLNPRTILQLDFISHFTLGICHTDGSRTEVPPSYISNLFPGIDIAETIAEQRRVGSLFDEHVSRLQLQYLPLTTANDTILCDVSSASHYSSVPSSLLRKVFSSLTNISCPGSRATDKAIYNRFIRSGMHKEVKEWARACVGCHRGKIQRQNKAPIGTFLTPDARFSHVHLDIVCPLRRSNDCSYLECVDRFPRWPEAIPLPDVAAPTVKALFGR
ncbi:hypothetical protein SprV_0100143900 [Sparganum proliferum]